MKLIQILPFILIFNVFVYIPLFTEAGSTECGSVPTDGCVVSQSTTFISGFYDLPNGISIAVSQVTLDCNGAILDGSNGLVNGNGITIIGKNNVLIQNCNIQYYKEYGIRANELHDSILRENNITHSKYALLKF